MHTYMLSRLFLKIYHCRKFTWVCICTEIQHRDYTSKHHPHNILSDLTQDLDCCYDSMSKPHPHQHKLLNFLGYRIGTAATTTWASLIPISTGFWMYLKVQDWACCYVKKFVIKICLDHCIANKAFHLSTNCKFSQSWSPGFYLLEKGGGELPSQNFRYYSQIVSNNVCRTHLEMIVDNYTKLKTHKTSLWHNQS